MYDCAVEKSGKKCIYHRVKIPRVENLILLFKNRGGIIIEISLRLG